MTPEQQHPDSTEASDQQSWMPPLDVLSRYLEHKPRKAEEVFHHLPTKEHRDEAISAEYQRWFLEILILGIWNTRREDNQFYFETIRHLYGQDIAELKNGIDIAEYKSSLNGEV